MQWFRVIACCAWIVLALAVAAVQGQEKKVAGKGIDAATIAAFEKLGAVYGGVYGGWVQEDGARVYLATRFREGRKHAKKGLPGFHFAKFPRAKLPDVA